MVRSADKAKVGLLYIIASDEQNAVKVGFAENLEMRLANLQTGNPAKLRIRFTHAATRGAEETLHRFLKPYRIGREWYPDTWLIDSIYDELGYELVDRALEQSELTGSDYTECHGQQFLTEADMRKVVPECVEAYQHWLDDGSPLSADELILNELELPTPPVQS